MTTKRAFVCGCIFSLTVAALVLAQARLGVPNSQAAEKSSVREAPNIIVNTNDLPKDTRGITSFAPVVKRVAPSVVTIYSTKTVRQELQTNPLLSDPFFRRFFGPDDGDEDQAPAPRSPRGRRTPRSREQTEQSLGSGVIISEDGYILSNNHVVEGADEVKVALSGSDDEYVAKVIGTDPQTDISVLKIAATNLPPVTMTDSDHLQVGDLVLAVGNPFGVGQTVTMGIVSATGRGNFRIVDYEDFIQTDAAINPGNSGGALVDAGGRLVGINTAIISRSGGSMGIGFAVPINMARRVMDSIIENGKVTRGYLGVYIQDVTPQLAKQFKLKDRSGALVGDVPDNTPAARAGLQPGDVITEFNGRKIPDSRQLRLWVSQTPPKTRATFKIVRDGKERTVNTTLGELPAEMAGGPNGKNRPTVQPKSDALDGVEVTDLDQRTRRQMGIPASIRGALVTAVDPSSTAAAAGLKEGDVILEINKQKVRNAQEAINLSDKLESNEQILLRIWSGGSTRYLVVEPEKPSGKKDDDDGK